MLGRSRFLITRNIWAKFLKGHQISRLWTSSKGMVLNKFALHSSNWLGVCPALRGISKWRELNYARHSSLETLATLDARKTLTGFGLNVQTNLFCHVNTSSNLLSVAKRLVFAQKVWLSIWGVSLDTQLIKMSMASLGKYFKFPSAGFESCVQEQGHESPESSIGYGIWKAIWNRKWMVDWRLVASLYLPAIHA